MSEQEHLLRVVEMLHNGLTGANPRQTQADLARFQSDAQFCGLLVRIFTEPQYPITSTPLPQLFTWDSYRQISGITLKNNIARAHAQLGGPALQGAAEAAIRVLRNEAENRCVASAACQIISKITVVAGFDCWQSINIDLASMLLNDMLGHNNVAYVHCGLVCLQYIMEDAFKQLGQTIGNIISTVSRVAVDHPDAQVRLAALAVVLHPYALGNDMNWNVEVLQPVQQGLVDAAVTFARAVTQVGQKDAAGSQKARKHFFTALTYLVDYVPYFTPQQFSEWGQTAQFWVSVSVDVIKGVSSAEESDAAASACDFLVAVADLYERCAGEGAIAEIEKALAPRIPELVTAMFPCMLMKEEEVAAIMEKDHMSVRDANVKRSAVTNHHRGSKGQGKPGGDDDDEMEVDELMANLRRAAGNALHGLSQMACDLAFPAVLQTVQSRWNDGDWRLREAVLTALGTAAKIPEFAERLRGDLPQLVQQLLQAVQNNSETHSILLSAQIWCLSQFVQFVHDTSGAQGIGTVVQSCLACFFKESKRVQDAAIGAVLDCVRTSYYCTQGETIQPVLQEVVETIHKCLPHFHTNNLVHLCSLFSMSVYCFPNAEFAATAVEPLRRLSQEQIPLFLQSMNDRYGSQNSNTLVNKDVFATTKAVVDTYITFVNPANSGAARELLDGWLGVLKNIFDMNVEDDSDLVHCPLDTCDKLIYAIDENSLCQFHLGNDRLLLQVALRAIANFRQLELRSCALSIIGGLAQRIGNNVSPNVDVIISGILPLLGTEYDDEPYQAFDCLMLLENLLPAYNAQRELVRLVQLIGQKVRTDTIGTHGRPADSTVLIATSLGRILSKVQPDILDLNTVNNVTVVLTLASNEYTKVEATEGIMKTFVAAVSANADNGNLLLRNVLKLAYSWQMIPRDAYPQLQQAITTMMGAAKQFCGQELHAQLSNLPPAFRDDIIQAYNVC